MKNQNIKHFLIFGGAGLVFLLDILTKWLVITNMRLSQSVEIIPYILSFTHVQNIGAGFSIFEGRRILLILISISVIIAILYFYKKIPQRKDVQCSVMLLLGGTIGNLLERITKGYVTDFIHISIWPKFNIADSAIVLGGIYLAYYLWKEEKREKEIKKRKIKR